MKWEMAENSLFAILLRSAWWISAGIAALMIVAALALLPGNTESLA
jgi:restriction system protein